MHLFAQAFQGLMDMGKFGVEAIFRHSLIEPCKPVKRFRGQSQKGMFEMQLKNFGVQIRGRNIKEITTVDDMRESIISRLSETAGSLRNGEPGPMGKLSKKGRLFSVRIGYGKGNHWFPHGIHSKSQSLCANDPHKLADALEQGVIPHIRGGAIDTALSGLLASYQAKFERAA